MSDNTGFSTDYSGLNDGATLLPIGEYEIIFKYLGEDVTKNGSMYVNVTAVVRNDVDQQYKNKYVWDKLWHVKEPSAADKSVGGYSFKRIQSISKAAGLPNGKKYENLEAWCDELANKFVRITIEHDEYNGKTDAKVKWYNESKSPVCKHIWKDKEEEEYVVDREEEKPAVKPAAQSAPQTQAKAKPVVDDSDDSDVPF